MYSITAKVKDINTVEGSYKNKLIAERHKRRLEKKYPGTVFEIERVNKRDARLNTYQAVMARIEKGKTLIMNKKFDIDPTRAKCRKCKTKWDLPTIREEKGYKPGICPECGGFLFSIKENLR